MAYWNRTKSFEAATSRETHSGLKPTLSWVHLVGLGVGGIVGTGIYTLTGVGPFLHDHPKDRPQEIFGGTNTLHFEPGRPCYVLLPVIPS